LVAEKDHSVLATRFGSYLEASNYAARFGPRSHEEGQMTVVYIEARPKGRQEGSPIEDYVVEDHADSVLATFKTQHDAVAWAKKEGHSPHVARVRHLNKKTQPDHWRAV
jgi:hypothetical protein